MELRLYSFSNFYLSSIQQGIQTGHAAVRLVRKYEKEKQQILAYGSHTDPEAHAMHSRCMMVEEWADRHETFIILNGGDFDGIVEASQIVEKSSLPYAFFHESASALAGIRTCVVFVAPENVFNAKLALDDNPYNTTHRSPYYLWVSETGERHVWLPSDPYFALIQHMQRCGLAR